MSETTDLKWFGEAAKLKEKNSKREKQFKYRDRELHRKILILQHNRRKKIMNSLYCKYCGHLYFSNEIFCPMCGYDDSSLMGIEDVLEDFDENYDIDNENPHLPIQSQGGQHNV
jgi:hypothetical protein